LVGTGGDWTVGVDSGIDAATVSLGSLEDAGVADGFADSAVTGDASTSSIGFAASFELATEVRSVWATVTGEGVSPTTGAGPGSVTATGWGGDAADADADAGGAAGVSDGSESVGALGIALDSEAVLTPPSRLNGRGCPGPGAGRAMPVSRLALAR
jgi:hypothetical protein